MIDPQTHVVCNLLTGVVALLLLPWLIGALGTQATFEACLRVLRPGGTLSSLGGYSTDLVIPFERLRRWTGRPPDRDKSVPWGQGTDASADVGDRVGTY
jgi:hypothetical protein